MALLWIPFLLEIMVVSTSGTPHQVLSVIWWTNISSPVTMYYQNCSPWLASCVKCMTGSPHKTSFVIICEVLRHPACTHFSVILLVNLMHLSSLVMACAQTCMDIHSGCCLSPCPPITNSTTPYPHLFPLLFVLCIPSSKGDKFSQV